MTHITASVEFHELAQGYRGASQDDAQEAYERLCEYLESRAADRRVVAASTDWRVYHSALSQCAEMLPNMKDGDPLTDAPKFLAAHLADRRVVAVAGSGDRNAVRLDKMLDWYLNEGKRSSIDPYGHISQTTKGHIIHWLDGGSNVDPQVRDRVASNAAPQQVDAVQAVPEWRSVLDELVSLIDDHLNGEYEIDSFTAQPARTLLAASPSPAVPPEPTKDRIKEIAVAMAVKVAKNVGTVPQLCFPDIYLDLTELFAGQAAQGAVPELVLAAERLEMAARNFNASKFVIGSAEHHAAATEYQAAQDAMIRTAIAQPTDTTAGE